MTQNRQIVIGNAPDDGRLMRCNPCISAAASGANLDEALRLNAALSTAIFIGSIHVR